MGFLLLYFFGLDLPSDIVKAMNLASYVILAPLILLRWKRCLYVVTRDIPLLLLVVMATASVFWSASPDYTSNEVKALIRTTLLGVYLATCFSIKEQMQILSWVLGIGAILSLVFALAVPSYGIHTSGEMIGAWKGIFIFKNLFASLMTITAILFLIKALHTPKKRWLSWIIFGIAILLLLLSNGKTSYSVFFIALCLLPLHKFVKQQYKWRTILLLITLIVGGSAIVLLLTNLEFIVVDTLGKNMEFNGRAPIWTLALDKGLERPWFGYGYSGFWTSEDALYVLYNTWGELALKSGDRFNAHNGYLDLFLALGTLGSLLYLLTLLRVFSRTVNLWISTKNIDFFWVLQNLVIIFLMNFSDTLGIVSTNAIWSLYVSFCLSIAVQENRLKKNYLIN